jgi:hypothetical protein
MNQSSKPQLSFSVGTNQLHGVLRNDHNRRDTLVQLVQHWAEDDARDDVINQLDALAEAIQSPREGELDALIERVEDAAAMDTAHTEINMHELLRLRDELDAVIAATAGRFNRSRIAAPRLLSGQRSAGAA